MTKAIVQVQEYTITALVFRPLREIETICMVTEETPQSIVMRMHNEDAEIERIVVIDDDAGDAAYLILLDSEQEGYF